ncbi:hypothetical protein L6164_025772 [Bauhinia variegata]|uniref:Uncharacterized protein n=1 Tax=Bauhinia variegata TaxID=167791 RepID=A0ACB9M1L0_BAUVA|nr:hypothetical protein L6164_025772 [Bauhinia variegata]
MTNEQIREKVYETHMSQNENYDVESLLIIVANIIKHSNQIVGTDPPTMTRHPARDSEHAQQKTMRILHRLENCNWGTKATITLAAFAVEYGNLLHLAEMKAITDASLGKLLAQLQNHWLQGIETKREALAELNKLVNMVLQATQQIIKLEEWCNISTAETMKSLAEEAKKDIPVYVYWIIIATVVCSTHIDYLKGDSEDKLELSQFDQKLSSVLTNLKATVTQIETEGIRVVCEAIKSCCII